MLYSVNRNRVKIGRDPSDAPVRRIFRINSHLSVTDFKETRN